MAQAVSSGLRAGDIVAFAADGSLLESPVLLVRFDGDGLSEEFSSDGLRLQNECELWSCLIDGHMQQQFLPHKDYGKIRPINRSWEFHTEDV